MSRKAKESGYRNATEAPERQRKLVEVPRPVFDSAEQKLRTEAALRDNPRLPGESLADHMERVGKIVGLGPERQPGEEG